MINKFKRHIILIALTSIYSFSFSQKVDHWESIIQVNDSCKYFVPSSNISSDWIKKDYDDSGWLRGKSGFGFGDDDDNTILPVGTRAVYMRFNFTVHNLSDIASLYLDMDYDDGFVAYLNGTEVARNNIKDPISWNMELTNSHEAILYKGVSPERYEYSEFISLLELGENVLVVEVHNQNATSDDLSANVFLHAGLTTTDTIYSSTPDWFVYAKLPTESNLPLMIISTNGQTIPNEPRIVADMGLIYNGLGLINKLDDEWNEYSGKISIESRGESSADFAKKSYSIELQKEDGSNSNVSLLGMPVENDFVLYGPYSDKTMMKNVLTYELFRRTGRWAPRTKYIELIINDDYKGVYVLTEKLKRDENRVDIDKLTAEDISPVDISGGYILRRDKKDELPPEAWWTSPVKQPYHQTMWYQCFDPAYDELTQNQTTYIKDWMKNFDEVMSGANFADTANGYKKYIKTKSFIDMMFINEISKGIDNYLFSTYFYKENDADGGQLVAGPPWDYNLGYGNLNYGESWDAKETYGWCYTQGSRVYWFERLMEDVTYQNMVKCRWSEFRSTIYSTENILAIIDSCALELGDAVDRNFTRYPSLGKYIWPAIEPYPTTYEGEIANLKTWLIGRLDWMDSQWYKAGGCSEPPVDISLSNNTILKGMPVGTVIGTLSTTDDDSDVHNYQLVAGLGDKDNAKFTIEGGVLLSNTVFNFQFLNLYSVRIKSEDESGASFEKAFDIEVKNTVSYNVEELFVNSITLYPNPSAQGIQLVSNNLNNFVLNVKLVDISGKLLFDYNGNIDNVNLKLGVDSRELNRGIYLVRIEVSGTVVSKRFVKL